jgi:hypothetical protein
MCVLQLAIGGLRFSGEAPVDHVSYGQYCYRYADHGVPSFMLSWDVDPGVASQVGIGVVAGEVVFAGILVALVIVVKIIVGFIVVHVSTFLLCRSPFGFAVVLLKVT